jgi:hypothetical protein
VLRFKVVRLCKEGLVQVEGPIKIIVLVPFVLGVVYFIVYRWLCKVELRPRLNSNFPNKTLFLTSFGAIRTISPGLSQRGTDNQTSATGKLTVFLMELYAQGR